MQVGIALIHAEQVAGKQRRLVAAGAGANFEDGVLLVRLVLGQQQNAHLFAQARDALVERRALGLGQRRHLRVGKQRFELAALLLRRLQLGHGGVHRLQLGALARQLDQHLAVERTRQAVVDFRHAGNDGADLFPGQ